jgi:uncharacterized membrane protein
MKKSQMLVHAAVAGILGASLVASSSAVAAAKPDETGQCVGANSCKGKSACAQKDKNACSGQNACKGKGWIEKTRAECEKIAKTQKGVRFETGTPGM